MHDSVKEMKEYHDERGEFESPTTCALDYHYEPSMNDGERISSKKPSLDYYDWKNK